MADSPLNPPEPGRAESPLLADAEFYRNLVETVNDGVITVDEAGTILFANHAAERIFGYGAAELVGASLTILMPESLRPRHLSGFLQYLATGQRRVNWDRIEMPGLSAM
jgi:PAS domain S-box-containing protein